MDRSLPALTPPDLDERQQRRYDAIVRGERVQGSQHFSLTAADGSLVGPVGVMLHAPELGDTMQQLGADLSSAPICRPV